jgi:hypothetical protein
MLKTIIDPYTDKGNCYIPGVVVLALAGDDMVRQVWFSWNGRNQHLTMEIQADGHWLITDTVYTDDFDLWLDENLADYDSLESMFAFRETTNKGDMNE